MLRKMGRSSLSAPLLRRLGAPGEPIDRVVRMLTQIRARLVDESIGEALGGHGGSFKPESPASPESSRYHLPRPRYHVRGLWPAGEQRSATTPGSGGLGEDLTTEPAQAVVEEKSLFRPLTCLFFSVFSRDSVVNPLSCSRPRQVRISSSISVTVVLA